MGDSRNSTPCEQMDFDHEVETYRTALTHLHSMPGIDADRIFLYGHSMVVLSAPLMATAAPIAGISGAWQRSRGDGHRRAAAAGPCGAALIDRWNANSLPRPWKAVRIPDGH